MSGVTVDTEKAIKEMRVTAECLADTMLYLLKYHDNVVKASMSEASYKCAKDWAERLEKARKELLGG